MEIFQLNRGSGIMKKIFLLVAFALTVSVAGAWTKSIDEAVVIVANEHLTPTAKSVVKKYLGKSFDDDVQYLYTIEREKAKQSSKKARQAAGEIHLVHLDNNCQPKDVKGRDALKATEAALVVIRNRKAHSKAEVTEALRTVITLMCDMHDLSKARIDGIPHSMHNFTYQTPAGEYGEKKNQLSKKLKWSATWGQFDGGFTHFTPNYWAMDLRAYIGNKYEDYAKGSLREWVVDNGKLSAHYYGIFKPKSVVSYWDRKWALPVSYDMVAKASCRLAALLNETIK